MGSISVGPLGVRSASGFPVFFGVGFGFRAPRVGLHGRIRIAVTVFRVEGRVVIAVDTYSHPHVARTSLWFTLMESSSSVVLASVSK